MKKMKLEISYKNGFIHIVEKDKGDNMGKYDYLDPTNENDQKYILRKVGEVMADITVTDPSDVAGDMGMPERVTDWLDEVSAYFLIEVRVDCQ